MPPTLTSCLLHVCRSVDALRRVTILLVIAAFVPGMRAAGGATKRYYDLSAGDAAATLRQFVEQSGEQVLYLVPKVRGVRTRAVKGNYTAREVIERMLANTVLIAVQDEQSGAFMIRRAGPDTGSAPFRSKPKEPKSVEHPHVMKRKNPIAMLGALISLALSPVSAADGPAPAGAGLIQGTVSNAATGAYLEGAEVSLDPGAHTVLSSRDGTFIFRDVAPGDYTLTATYTGLDAKSVSTTLPPGGRAVHDVALTSGIYQLSTFVVEGEREGNALAITQQRNAVNVKNILSSDAFGNVADLNIANFLQRIPGFSTEMSEGEIIRVQIRGTAAGMNSFSVDGTRTANGTTRTFERGADIDRLSADFIETIEVTKAMTPDQDADSIGGSVNLKSKSALDRKGRRITYNFAQNYNVAQKTFRPLGNIGYSDIILEGKLGFLFTASYNESHKPRDYNEFHWETVDDSRPAWFNNNASGEDQLRHKRMGAGLRFDYKLNETTRLFFSTNFSFYEDQLHRRWARLASPAAASIVSVSPTVTETRNHTFTWHHGLRNRDTATLNLVLGGESLIRGGKLDFTLSRSRSKGTDDNISSPRVITGTGFRQERFGPYVRLTQISGNDIFDWNNSVINAIDTRDLSSWDEIDGAQINYRKPLQLRVPVAIKVGGRYRDQKRSRNEDYNEFSYVGPNGVVGPVGPNNDDNLERFFDSGYVFHPNDDKVIKHAGLAPRFMKLVAIKDAMLETPQFFRENIAVSTRDSITNDANASESVAAAYIMGEVRLFDRLDIAGGVRVEETRMEGDGFKQEITAEERDRRAAWVGPVTPEETVRRAIAEFRNPVRQSAQYRDYFPSIHFKYSLTKNLIARASFSTGIGRPSFSQIVPRMTVNHDTQVLTANNPDLEPQYSKNRDITLEYYFKPAGVLSVAAFEKRLTNFIYRNNRGTLGPDNEYGAAYEGYQLTSDYNGGTARIRGLEASFQQQFSNLPGFWKGFGVYANYTWQEAEGEYRTPGVPTTQADLVGFQPRSGNIGITYIDHGWTIRVQALYTSTRLGAFSTNPAARNYLRGGTPVDVSLAYAFSRKFRVYADIINVFNVNRQDQYRYIPDRPLSTLNYTPVVKIGVSGTF